MGNSDCDLRQTCHEHRCVDPCGLPGACGSGARCEVNNHVAICRCPNGMTGNPHENCRKFTRAEICAVCGPNTECEVGPGDQPICKCVRSE